VGALASVNFVNVVTVTARLFGDFWSDKLCPSIGSKDVGMPACTLEQKTKEGRIPIGADELERLQKIFGDDVTEEQLQNERNGGARFYISLALEVALHQNLSMFLIVEGAPGQGERAMHTELFNNRMLGRDVIYNGRLGLIFKY